MRGSWGWLFNVYVTPRGKFYWLGCVEGTGLEAITVTYCMNSKQWCGEDGIQGSTMHLKVHQWVEGEWDFLRSWAKFKASPGLQRKPRPLQALQMVIGILPNCCSSSFAIRWQHLDVEKNAPGAFTGPFHSRSPKGISRGFWVWAHICNSKQDALCLVGSLEGRVLQDYSTELGAGCGGTGTYNCLRWSQAASPYSACYSWRLQLLARRPPLKLGRVGGVGTQWRVSDKGWQRLARFPNVVQTDGKLSGTKRGQQQTPWPCTCSALHILHWNKLSGQQLWLHIAWGSAFIRLPLWTPWLFYFPLSALSFFPLPNPLYFLQKYRQIELEGISKGKVILLSQGGLFCPGVCSWETSSLSLRNSSDRASAPSQTAASLFLAIRSGPYLDRPGFFLQLFLLHLPWT